jgi:hypothetical protein
MLWALRFKRIGGPDSFVTNFHFTEPAWRLLQHNPPDSRRSRAVAALRVRATSGCEQSQQARALFD